MNVIVCLDDRNGMMFNKRRQSRDSVLRERVLELAKDSRLLMNGYSAKQFEGAEGIISDEAFLENAIQGDFCFAENVPLKPWEDKIESLYVFRWNRAYPGDMFFDIALEEPWKLLSSVDFEGSSHEKITQEVYTR